MTPELEIRRAGEAKQVLNSPIYKEAFSTIQQSIVNQLSLADTPKDRRDKLNDLLVALAKVRVYMEQVMVSGNLAETDLERKRTMAERIRNRFAA